MGALLGKRAVRERDGEAGDGGSLKKKARVVARDRSGQDRTGRHQTRDQTGRDQDRSGRLKVEDDPRLQRAWGTTGHGDNRDNSRSDVLNSLDDPYQRYITSWSQRRSAAEVSCRIWSKSAEPCLPQPCRLCPDRAFVSREEWQAHVDEHHGGTQRYRNALWSLLSLSPYVVKGQEVRSVIANFSEFYARSALDWEKFTTTMATEMQDSPGTVPSERWHPRSRRACAFCARSLWREQLAEVYLAGPKCFMKAPDRVAELLSWESYHERWPDIPAQNLQASAVALRTRPSRFEMYATCAP